jgi:hypothetical protein
LGEFEEDATGDDTVTDGVDELESFVAPVDGGGEGVDGLDVVGESTGDVMLEGLRDEARWEALPGGGLGPSND